jgi:hypothetical protein
LQGAGEAPPPAGAAAGAGSECRMHSKAADHGRTEICFLQTEICCVGVCASSVGDSACVHQAAWVDFPAWLSQRHQVDSTGA